MPNIRFNPFLFLLILLCVAHPALAADEKAPPPPPVITENDILPYLEQVIAWQRAVADTELLPDNAREVVLKDRLRQNAKKALQKSFDFARAEAAIVKPEGAGGEGADPATTQSRQARMQKSLNEVNARVKALMLRLKTEQLTQSQREKLMGDVKLASAQQELLLTMQRIFSSEGDTKGGLLDQINALSRTVLDEPVPGDTLPVKEVKEEKLVESDASKDEKSDAVQSNDGMFRLIGSMFTFSRKKSEIDALIQQTQELSAANRKLVTSIRASLKKALADGNALTASDDAQSMSAYRESLDGLIVRYRQLASTVIPLGEMNVLLRGSERRLQEWSRLIDEDWSRVFRQLSLRLVVLSIAITIPLLLSELARRATNRYVQDPKRQRQLRIARRIMLAILLTFVILANFLSEFGSLATFAGFITAGLAVALQTVLVSLVAHFFFFGRYGVRAGDRITVSGVTGDVVQVGMLRLYIRELEEKDGDFATTGKVVAFPNSILFQPTAFYKHVNW